MLGGLARCDICYGRPKMHFAFLHGACLAWPSHASWVINILLCSWHPAGVYVEEGPDRDALTAALAKEYYVPVYLDPKVFDLHYNGFCNSVLWQLFHYVPLNMDSKLSETRTLQVGGMG